MNIKKSSIIAGLLLLTGCATTAPTQLYRAAGEAEQLAITGEYKPLQGFNGSISISIDKEKIISDSLPYASNFELSGKYKDKVITAACNKRPNPATFTMSINCLILVDNERAATLSF